ncbi:uncharacterized protein BHQ10_009317 [Talaromyces amestolkiae]|uniref:Arsenite methyltransferase n=1 Tax=Talaromyces amestolkiae TaxID=1196081 RepID=A0A364LBU7_TALAM|nr:uncharacterized protein BHQ10_009317 [Talaromyces amestolkiae]RAO73305.1 hypothetical protein BHQ10_009317 [Talaromyces amestolkiae]
MADTYHLVQSSYGDIAKKTVSSPEQDGERNIALAFGYSEKDLLSLPEKTNLGLSCGNPVAYANVKEGETVVDLGSGGGIDVFLAARKVGPTGKAVGIDMTKDMINLATKNAKASGLSNTSFIEASITSIPLPDSSVDCIISNCVINLVPAKDKGLVFLEIARLLKPGGRLAISDILARKELPRSIVDNMELYVGCIAGASQVAEYEEYLRQAGFQVSPSLDKDSEITHSLPSFSSVNYDNFIELDSDKCPFSKIGRVTYHSFSETLIVKVMPGEAHEITAQRFNDILAYALRGMNIRMELRNVVAKTMLYTS